MRERIGRVVNVFVRVREGKTIEDLTSTQIWQNSKSTVSKTKNETKGKQISCFPFPGNRKILLLRGFSPLTTLTRDRKTRTSKKGDIRSLHVSPSHLILLFSL